MQIHKKSATVTELWGEWRESTKEVWIVPMHYIDNYFHRVATRFAHVCVLFVLCAGAAKATVQINSADFLVRQNPANGYLYAQGEVGTYVNVTTAGTYTFVLYAYGTPVQGVYPSVGLSIDGFVKTRQTVSGTAQYTYTGAMSAGVHQVGWFLHNNLAVGSEDRNVYIGYMKITPPAGGVDVAVSNKTAWTTAAQARETAAVAESATGIETYRKGPLTVRALDPLGRAISGATVTVQQLSHDFRFGASTASLNSFGTTTLNNAYTSKFKALFNASTVPVYWNMIEPTQGLYTFTHPDNQVNWAVANGIRPKAHAVLYALPAAFPPWMNGVLPSVTAQQNHVSVLMNRYKANVDTWDVLNESFNEKGLDIVAAHAKARQVAPSAKLVVNDYGEFYNGAPDWFSYLQGLASAGTPYDVIGMQAHAPTDMAFPLDRVRDVLAHYATLGKTIHITEFTPSSAGFAVTGCPWRTTWNEATQAEYAEKFYRVCFASPSVEAIYWWDFCDTGAWLTGGGLLRSDLSAKPAYDRLNALINTEWRGNLSGQTDSAGAYTPRAFYGKHRVTVTASGKTKSVDVQVTKGATNEISMTLDVPVAPPAVSVARVLTKSTKPTLSGSVVTALSVSARVNGVTYATTVTGSTWNVAIPNSLPGGIYEVVATATGPGGATAIDPTQLELTVDVTRPTIALNGASTVYVKHYATYTDAGATASDNVDGNITARVLKTGTVNTNTRGTYYVRYNVADTAGNAAAQATRTVIVTK